MYSFHRVVLMYHYSHGIVSAVFQGWMLIQIYVVSLELKWYPVETASLAELYGTSVKLYIHSMKVY